MTDDLIGGPASGPPGDRFARLDGAYLLGALEPAERAEFEAHLAGCPTCGARVDELRPTIARLAAARASGAFDAAQAGPVPDTLLPALLRGAVRERRRHRWVSAGIGLVAAACLVALIVVAWPGGSSSSHRPVAGHPVVLQHLRSTPVEASAVLVSRPWGTQIHLRCRYEHYHGPVPPDLNYGLRVIDTDNRVHDAGTWALVPSGVTRFTGGTDVRRERIARVQVVLPDGTAILQLVT